MLSLLSTITTEVQSTIFNIVLCTSGAWLGYKKLLKHGNKEDLDSTKLKTERNVIDLIYARLTDLDAVNRALTAEFESLRRENVQTRIQNDELLKEVQQLKKFIEQNFTATILI